MDYETLFEFIFGIFLIVCSLFLIHNGNNKSGFSLLIIGFLITTDAGYRALQE